jgi:hypothetical protein
VLAGGDRSIKSYEVPDLSVTDTERIFSEAGMSPEEVSKLRESGVLN